MLKKIIGKLWKKTPSRTRLRIIRMTQKKFTASVAAVIFNEAGKVLLLDHVLRPFSNWGLPGGFMDSDEQPEQAIRREIYEETNLELENVELFRIRTLGRHIEILYTAKSKGKARVNSREINDLGWFDEENLPEKLSAAQRKIISELLQKMREKH